MFIVYCIPSHNVWRQGISGLDSGLAILGTDFSCCVELNLSLCDIKMAAIVPIITF